MGVACAPDIFQSIMMDLLGDLDFVLVYINDILIIQQEGEAVTDHLNKVEIFSNAYRTKASQSQSQKILLYAKKS